MNIIDSTFQKFKQKVLGIIDKRIETLEEEKSTIALSELVELRKRIEEDLK